MTTKMTTFKLFALYLQPKGFTQENIACKSNYSGTSIKRWVANGFPANNDATLFSNILFSCGDNEQSTIKSFLRFIKNNGYNVPYELFDKEKISRSEFEDFFAIFLLDKNFKNSSASTEDDLSSENNIYFPQSVFNANTSDVFFEIDKANFKEFKKKRLILIEGEGGLGKSTFVKKVSKLRKKQKQFKNIIILSLANFVIFVSRTNNGIQSQNSCDMILNYIKNIRPDIDISTIINDKCETLLLLDGFNETYAFSDVESRNIVISDLQCLKENYPNITFVVTSRPSEGSYSLRKCEFLQDFSVYYLSGVTENEYNKFCASHPDLSDKIKEFAKIPLYFNALNKTENLANIKNENDLLKEIYYLRYKQASTKIGAKYSFAAFYLLAPAIADYMSLNRKTAVEYSEILSIAKTLFSHNNPAISLLHACASKECPTSEFSSIDEYEEICNVLVQNGPMETNETDFETAFSFFHQEIYKYLLSLYAWIVLSATQLAVYKDFSYIEHLNPNLNLNYETVTLLKEKLNFSHEDEEEVFSAIKAFFNYQNIEHENLPQQVIYFHNAFLFSEYFGYRGMKFLSVFHEIISPIVKEISSIIEAGDANYYLNGISPDGINYLKTCFLDLLCKECQYYRESTMYDEGEYCIKIANIINKNNLSIIHQNAMLRLDFFEVSYIHPHLFGTENMAFGDTHSYDFALEMLTYSSSKGFILSANLLSLIFSAPSPILFNTKRDVKIDYIQSFCTVYSAIIESIRHKAYALEIDYSVRQAVALLIKGYVKIKDGHTYKKGEKICSEELEIGNYNTFNLDGETIKLVKYLLEFVDGLYRPALNYYRAIIKIYDNKDAEAESLLKKESDLILSQIVLNYKFGASYDIDKNINDIWNKRNSNIPHIDACDPLYWAVIDSMYLEISLNPKRKVFYDNMIKGFDPVCREIVKLSKQ